MSAVAAGHSVVDDRFSEMMSLCLQCRACESACPSLVPFGEAMEATRNEVDAQLPSSRSWITRLSVTRVVRSRLVMRVVTLISSALQRLGLLSRLPIVGKLTRGMRQLSSQAPPVAGTVWGPDDGRVAMLLSGCVADAWFPDVHRSAIDVLVRAGFRVDAPGQQTCCGALAAHSGYAEDAAAMAAVNTAAFEGADVIITDVAGCGAQMESYGRYGERGAQVAGRVQDIDELVADLILAGDLPFLEPTGIPVGVQDPCHLEHGQKVHTTVDAIIKAAGYTAVPIDRGGLCCGAAGLYQVAHAEVSEELGRAKAAAASRSGASIVVSANAGCEMQLRRYLGEGFRVVHPIELYAEALRGN